MDTAIDISETRACHCLAARRQARAITRIFEEKLRPHGLRATQFSILAVLTLKGTTTVKALAEVLGLERTTLTRVSGVLERKGLVTTAESSDARQRPLCITLAGRRTLEHAFPAWKEAQELVGRMGSSDEGEATKRDREKGKRRGNLHESPSVHG